MTPPVARATAPPLVLVTPDDRLKRPAVAGAALVVVRPGGYSWREGAADAGWLLAIAYGLPFAILALGTPVALLLRLAIEMTTRW